MSGIYIHVPFCYQRCHYCDFYSTLRLNDRSSFVDALIREIKYRKNFLGTNIVDTIYFGGGTPSVLSHNDIERILEAIKNIFAVSEDAEITLEANPDDLSMDYLNSISKTALNRLSIGIQSFNDDDLKKLNRRHDAQQAIEAVRNAKDSGFSNMSIDLIYGLPKQTEEKWKENLETALDLEVDHISAYHLTYEKGTLFHRWLKKGQLEELKDEQSLSLFNMLVETMEEHAYEQYEISNFARKGQYSRHNTKYWFGRQYLGLGPSAHSFNGQLRQWNIADIDKWMDNEKDPEKYVKSEIIDKLTQRNELIMTRLRTIWGIPKDEYTELFGDSSWEDLLKMAQPFISKNFMELKDNALYITRQGKFLSDGIIADLFEL